MENIIFIENYLWTYIGIPLLIILGIYFSITFKFMQLSKIPLMFKLLFKVPKSKTGITSFQSFSMALAARVGVGSLAGLGLAIALGGYGTIFWMWIIAILGSASAFVESTLSQIYKENDKELSFGGVSYYIKNGLGFKRISIFFAILFAIVYGLFFPLVQTDSIVTSFITAGIIEPSINHGYFISFILCIILSTIIFGGAKSIAKTTEKVVPFMAFAFVGLGIIIILKDIPLFVNFFYIVIHDAMNPQSFISGGFITVVMYGVKRGIFANEAGMGSGATAAASADVDYPIESGLTQALSVLITSLIIGTVTAFIIFSASFDLSNLNFTVSNGIELTIEAFKFHFGNFGVWFLVISVVLFAFSTILTACYYLESSIFFLTKDKNLQIVGKFFILLTVFIGGSEKSSVIWSITDFGVALMAIINAFAMLLLFKKVKKEWNKTKDRI